MFRISRPDMMYLFFLCLLGCGIPVLSHGGLLDLAQAVEASTLFSKDAWVHAEGADDGNKQILVRDPSGKPIVVRDRTSELMLPVPRDQVFNIGIKQILVRGQTGKPIVVRDASPPDQVFQYQEQKQDDRQKIGPWRSTSSPSGTQDGLQVDREEFGSSQSASLFAGIQDNKSSLLYDEITMIWETTYLYSSPWSTSAARFEEGEVFGIAWGREGSKTLVGGDGNRLPSY